jgi:hypothetical protein
VEEEQTTLQRLEVEGHRSQQAVVEGPPVTCRDEKNEKGGSVNDGATYSPSLLSGRFRNMDVVGHLHMEGEAHTHHLSRSAFRSSLVARRDLLEA